MKILFIQLPLLDHSYNYVPGNIDYAPGAISAFLSRNYSGEVTCELLPYIIANFGSDQTILRFIKKINPDILSFTSYLWNIERNLYLAEKIRQADPVVKIIFGGPEIASGSFAFKQKREYVDIFVSGEGEWFFKKFISGTDFKENSESINGNFIVVQPESELTQISEIVEPFTNRMTSPMPDGSIFLEMTRGCPFKCAYCYYSKTCSVIRDHDFRVLEKAINFPVDLKEIYILSPAFDRSKDFRNKLRILSDLNTRGICLHSEMRAENITADVAAELSMAGFRSMEVGLQTLNRESLKAIGRNSDPEKELTGMKFLQRAGIKINIGIIPGLPGDDILSFKNTIDRLIGEGFSDSIELYPLMILPGTSIRDMACSKNIKYMDKPPYFYEDGWGISSIEVGQLSEYLADQTGLSHESMHTPDLMINDDGLFIKGIYFNGDSVRDWGSIIDISNIETAVFSFYIKIQSEENLLTGLETLFEKLTVNELYNVVLISDMIIDDSEIIALLDRIETDSFFRRMNFFSAANDKYRVRFYQIFEDQNSCMTGAETYEAISPVLKITGDNYKNLMGLIDGIHLLIESSFYREIKSELIEVFREEPELVLFENEEDQYDFYKAAEFEFVKLPFRNRVLFL